MSFQNSFNIKKRTLSFWLITLLIVTFIGVIIKLNYSRSEPPLDNIHLARKKITNARFIKADVFAAELYRLGLNCYDSAMLSWERENHRFVYFRDYNSVNRYAGLSVELIDKAISITRNRLQSEEKLMNERMQLIENQLHEFENKYGHFPFVEIDTRKLAAAKIMFHEGEFAWEQSNYHSAKTKMDSVEQALSDLFEKYDNITTHYLSQYSHWQKMVKRAVDQSRKGKSYCIIIDKYHRNCILYKNGKLVNEYDVELGENWMGDKLQQGDKTTPEGVYEILARKSNGKTMYYKALLLNYPNEEDKERFRFNKKNGIIKENASIGNLIEIHGNGGKGFDWTNGCVALCDDDMDVIYEKCPKGTPVIIVGSTKSMSELNLNH